MGAIRTNAAAAMLGVSPNTLRTWERRFGHPAPRRTAGGHRLYDVAEIEALRSAFAETGNVSSAVALARERGAGPASAARLRAALERFDAAAAEAVLEESLATRSVERTVGELVLPTVELLAGGAELGFAWRWATGWLAAQGRLTPAATRPHGVLLYEATGVCDPESLHAQALELALRRRGLRTQGLPFGTEPDRVGRALRAVRPGALVLAGRRAPLDALGRLVFAVRRAEGDRVRVLDFRGALPDTGASTVDRLDARAAVAADELLARLEGATVPPGAVPRGRAGLRAVAGGA